MVGKNKALVVVYHQDKNLMEQLKQPRAMMGRMRDTIKELPGGEFFTMVLSGIFFKSDWS